ncbi:WxL domain surface cell wall-binding [Pilibacter termitis]|uniref:WxL domain surface cell wall-binding n=1 Tax=Pilibacter termitis TaxID=263852 RepID=A0A1T4KC01_9ENTE|nr:WxL domain-containing protein [Pilibacter termitis]SJZ39949.1 WxL domain surface cell wall-binding [Pilibacter termitis]
MKSIIKIVLFTSLISLSPAVVGAEVGNTNGSITLEKGMVVNPPTKLEFVARDPENPARPFPANPIYKTSESSNFGTVVVNGQSYWGQLEFDLDPEVDATKEDKDIFQEATDEKPMLYSWRAYLKDPQTANGVYNEQWHQNTGLPHAGLVYVPVAWDFGMGYASGEHQALQGVGYKSLYTDRISHLQMWDNRTEDNETGWTVRAKLNDYPTDEETKEKLVGAYITIPKAVARNEFNTLPSSNTLASEKSDDKFITKEVNITATDSVVLWETKGKAELATLGYTEEQIKTTGKGMSTLTWNTADVQLHIPENKDFQIGDYHFGISWSIEKGPEA